MDTPQNRPADESTPDSPGTSNTPDDGAPAERPVPYLPPRPSGASGDIPRSRRRGWWWLVATVAVLAIIAFVVVPLITSPQGTRNGESLEPAPTVTRNAEPGIDGIVAREVPPVQLRPGDCLTDFTSVSEPSTVVECTREHDAQLVGRKLWPTDRAFPADMKADAEAFCATIELASATEAQVLVEISHPAEGTWAEGDRRVDCLAVARDGALHASLVTEPSVQDWTEHQD